MDDKCYVRALDGYVAGERRPEDINFGYRAKGKASWCAITPVELAERLHSEGIRQFHNEPEKSVFVQDRRVYKCRGLNEIELEQLIIEFSKLVEE